MSGIIPDEAVEAAAKVFHQDGWEGPPFWESLDQDDPSRLEYLATARAALEAAAPFIASQALEDAAAELARLPYVKPDEPGRAEYESVLAVRRGNADGWLLARAATLRGKR
jgi:hypothetical protein